jgi:hypothetical protein
MQLRRIQFVANRFITKSLINLNLVGDVGKRFQNDERHDESATDKSGEKYTEKNA